MCGYFNTWLWCHWSGILGCLRRGMLVCMRWGVLGCLRRDTGVCEVRGTGVHRAWGEWYWCVWDEGVLGCLRRVILVCMRWGGTGVLEERDTGVCEMRGTEVLEGWVLAAIAERWNKEEEPQTILLYVHNKCLVLHRKIQTNTIESNHR